MEITNAPQSSSLPLAARELQESAAISPRSRFAWASLLAWGLSLACTADIGELDSPDLNAADLQEAEILVGLKAGDEFEIDGVVMEAPAVGHGITQHVFRADGTATSIAIDTKEDGQVVRSFPVASDLLEEHGVVPPAAEPQPGAIAAAHPSCRPKIFNVSGKRWKERLYWYASSKGKPGYLNTTKMEADFLKSMAVITRSKNRCGMKDLVSAKATYKGLTRRRPSISAGMKCTGTDGRNVMGFKYIGISAVGAACTYREGNKIIEADVAFNNAYKWFHGAKVPANCKKLFRKKWGIRRVASHEFGHVFGLSHVDNKWLMMGRAGGTTCHAGYLLGRGDVRGLRHLY